jgi:hypothetical protein
MSGSSGAHTHFLTTDDYGSNLVARTSYTTTTFSPVHQTPVGGVMFPSVGFGVLLLWAIVLSLLGILSVEAFTIKRRAKRR